MVQVLSTWLRKRSSALELARLRCRNTGQQPSMSSRPGFVGPPAMPARACATYYISSRSSWTD